MNKFLLTSLLFLLVLFSCKNEREQTLETVYNEIKSYAYSKDSSVEMTDIYDYSSRLLDSCCESFSKEEMIKTLENKKYEDVFIKNIMIDLMYSSVLDLLVEESKKYLLNRDFDGDKANDYIYFEYSGGAHCCYKMSLKLSTINDTINYPFEMDGGYGFGIVDGSNHDQFNIADYDQDGLPEIFMQISSYNDEKYPIDPDWTKEYGIKTNYIIFNYNNSKVVLEDYNMKKHKLKTNLN